MLTMENIKERVGLTYIEKEGEDTHARYFVGNVEDAEFDIKYTWEGRVYEREKGLEDWCETEVEGSNIIREYPEERYCIECEEYTEHDIVEKYGNNCKLKSYTCGECLGGDFIVIE